MLWRTA